MGIGQNQMDLADWLPASSCGGLPRPLAGKGEERTPERAGLKEKEKIRTRSRKLKIRNPFTAGGP